MGPDVGILYRVSRRAALDPTERRRRPWVLWFGVGDAEKTGIAGSTPEMGGFDRATFWSVHEISTRSSSSIREAVRSYGNTRMGSITSTRQSWCSAVLLVRV